jgi:endonuclease/exonuclease/phosphatase family metal-dependent hydrolase
MCSFDDQIETLIARIHATPTLAMIVFAGAGSQALFWLHRVAGSSRTVLEALDTYAATSLGDFLGYTPAQFVAPATATAMARRAYERALVLRRGEEPVVGLACTATIATDRPKRGEHRAHVAVADGRQVALYSLHLAKGKRDRAGEEEMVSRLMIQALAEACGIETPSLLELHPSERLEVRREPGE